MDKKTEKDVLADAFYNRGVEPDEVDGVVREVLQDLANEGYVIVYSERVWKRNND